MARDSFIDPDTGELKRIPELVPFKNKELISDKMGIADFSMLHSIREQYMKALSSDLEVMYRTAFTNALAERGYIFQDDSRFEEFLKKRVLEVRVEGSLDSSYFLMPEQDYLFTVERKTEFGFHGDSYRGMTDYKIKFNTPPKVDLDSISYE